MPIDYHPKYKKLRKYIHNLFIIGNPKNIFYHEVHTLKNYLKTKLFVFFLLSITTAFCIVPSIIASSSVPLNEHKKIITQYIQDIRILQNQVFSLFESLVSAPPQDPSNLDSKANFIYSQIQYVDRNITNYLNTVPRLSSERRDTLIALDALHFLENSFYQLTALIKETDSTKRTQSLEDFYFLRTSTTNTLNSLESIISRE